MAEFASLDEEKLNAYLRSLGSNKKVPKSLLGANLALLWESIGFAKRDQGIEATATAREVNPGTSLFPANAASQRLRAAKDTIDGLTKQHSQLQNELASLHVKVSMHTAYISRAQKLNLLLQWQRQQIQTHTCRLQELLKNAADGGLWAEASSRHNLLLRASLEQQVAAKLDLKRVDTSRLDWTQQNDGDLEVELAFSGQKLPQLKAGMSVAEACKEQMQEDLQLIRLLLSGVNRSADAQAIIDDAPSLKVSGVPDFDELLHKSRDEHVSIFFETQQAAKSVKEVGSKIAALHTSLDRLCGGSAAGEQRKALLTVIADVAGNHAAVSSLVEQLEVHKRRETQLKDCLQGLLKLQESVVDSRLQNLMVDRLIQELVTEGSAILSRWLDGANQVRGLIHVASEHNTQLATQQARMASMLAAETATLPKVPCLQHQATDQAQQLFLAPEAQRAGLKHAVQQLSILQKVQSTLEESEAMASINPAKKIGQQYIMYNLDIDNEELRMDETLKVVQAASKKATDVVPEVLQAWWDQPAVGCAPWIKHEGKSAKDVLKQMRSLHAAGQSSTASEL